MLENLEHIKFLTINVVQRVKQSQAIAVPKSQHLQDLTLMCNLSIETAEVPEFQRADAANSLVYEANVRLRDPIYGCMGAISALQHQVQALQAELNSVRAEILRYKYREAATTILAAELPQAPPTPTPSQPAPVGPTAGFGGGISNNNVHLPYFD
ncbi:LOB domain-containing protein [Striga asiatica]|uniref:LOB domain-containing protein n=1 Tax=Striga asiatica TaxID=4170 RepID=A0A5A7RAJ2_STRAF|nr:LOB domain-containing protein [Striga asiatica]